MLSPRRKNIGGFENEKIVHRFRLVEDLNKRLLSVRELQLFWCLPPFSVAG